MHKLVTNVRRKENLVESEHSITSQIGSAPFFWRLTYVDLVLCVSDVEILVDAPLVDVGDHGHVGHAVRRTTSCGRE